jgi:hypothetical protein
MKYQNVIVYLMIPLALLSIPSLLENVNAQTTSDNQTEAAPPNQQENQNTTTLTTQALMKVDIFEIQDTLKNAKLAIFDGNLDYALAGVRDVESQLLEVEPSPIQVIKVLHKTINAIADSDIEKSLNTLTRAQVTLLKAENQIFKASVAEDQVIQQFDTMESNTNEEREEYTNIEVPNMVQQFDTMESTNDEEAYTMESNANEDYTDIEDS